MGGALYDRIGTGYAALRRPDPRLVAAIGAALGDARSVLDVGAGTGSYEPAERRVVAVEPSLAMIRQRAPDAAPVVRALAERLPFRAASFDACLAVLTLHHWSERSAGLAELRRVARRRVVLVTWDPAHEGFWLVREHFPDLLALDRRIFPSLDELERALGPLDVRVLAIPHDCADGFLGAYWRRPEAYLDARVRAAISSFTRLERVEERLEGLREELAGGRWHARHGELLAREELDLGYRLVVAERGC